MILEVNLDALAWIDTIAERLERGYLLAIDYGYTAAELVRFPRGTLMTYRRHQASPDALADPGGRDITAHVNFSALEDHARRRGFAPIRAERLAQTLMAIGQPDQFASVLAAAGEKEAIALRLQLKTLVFGMGETFRTLLAGRKHFERAIKKAPIPRGRFDRTLLHPNGRRGPTSFSSQEPSSSPAPLQLSLSRSSSSDSPLTSNLRSR